MKTTTKIKTLIFSLGAFLTLPFLAHAITFEDIVGRILELLSILVPVLISLAVIGFLYGAVRYIFSAGDPAARVDGTKFMVYAVVALFVMVSVWGFVAILQETIFAGDTGNFQGVPQIEI